MTCNKIKKAMKRDSVQTALMIGIIVLVVFALWFGSQAILGTDYPALAVASGSMCITQHMGCDGFSRPFDRTLHVGDLIIVQGVDPALISDSYPNSDIIVFHKPTNTEELIVHRVVKKEEINGTIYFRTKGDANGNHKWPEIPNSSEYDSWLIPQNMVVGRVVIRVPWVGHLALFMRNSLGIYVIIAIVLILIIVEFAAPAFKKKPINTEAPLGNSDEGSAT